LLLAAAYLHKWREDRYLATFSPTYGKTIVIDPGHGGFDAGASGVSGSREDEINLAIALKLRDYLEHEGAKVVMTRKDHNAVADTKRKDMEKRVEIIRKSKPDIVISIHQNKFRQPQYYGAQTFYMTGSEEGKRLAKCIQDHLIRVLNRGNKRQIKPAGDLLILKAGNAPTVIVECGFLSNPEEERLLKTEKYQDRVAWAIYSGVVEYFASPAKG